MRNRWHTLIKVHFSLFLCLLLLPVSPALLCADSSTKIKLSADLWFPFNGDPKSERPGYIVEIAKEIFETKGYLVDYTIMPWSRSIAELEAGRIDGIIGATPEEVENAVFPDEPLGLVSDNLFVVSGSAWRYKDQRSFDDVVIGGIKDYDYGELINKYISAHSKDPKRVQLTSGENALEQNIRKLSAKRIDAVIESPEVFWSKLAELGLPNSDFMDAGSPQGKDPIYICFSAAGKDSKKLAEILSKGIIELRVSGKLAEILARYGLKDWK